MVLKKLNFYNSAAIALLLTISMLVVDMVMKAIGFGVRPLFSISPVSPISGTAAETVFGFLGGYLPLNFTAIMMMFVSAFVIVWVGAFLMRLGPGIFQTYGFKKGSKVGNIFWMVIYGALAFYIIVVGAVMQSWQVLVGLSIYTLIVSYASAWLAPNIGVKIE